MRPLTPCSRGTDKRMCETRSFVRVRARRVRAYAHRPLIIAIYTHLVYNGQHNNYLGASVKIDRPILIDTIESTSRRTLYDVHTTNWYSIICTMNDVGRRSYDVL